MKHNHDIPLSDSQDDIDKLKASGYNPIAVSQMYLEVETKEQKQKEF